MAFLEVVQAVALRVIGSRPISAFTPNNDVATVREIVDLANDVARDIAASHDWQAITRIHTIEGDGETKEFPLPDEYDRMLLASEVIHPEGWFWRYSHITSVTDWIRETNSGWGRIGPGAWIIMGNALHFDPAPAAGARAEFPYISKQIVKGAGGQLKPAFTADNDAFLLDERLLTLGTIWRWKAQKSLEYAEDMESYELALSQQQARDGGARVIRSASRPARNTRPAWPWPLGGH